MKFGKKLRSQLIIEWRGMYLDYKALKKQIKKVVRHRDHLVKQRLEALDADEEAGLLDTSEDVLKKSKPLRKFFQMMKQYLETVERFYLQKVAETEVHFYQLATLLIQLDIWMKSFHLRNLGLMSKNQKYTFW